uniref:Uncharacterized protein n=1 Tax=Polytomella parva TaxID=51329 RepID=A0A7S0YBN3_9CHLO|mmetsp:Transcript_1557/g.2239  ORF Transcript_1557/g.2239 Transcript_1557/m.2239 type:complete len:406 (+) Transcript_1557:73-1290(+)
MGSLDNSLPNTLAIFAVHNLPSCAQESDLIKAFRRFGVQYVSFQSSSKQLIITQPPISYIVVSEQQRQAVLDSEHYVLGSLIQVTPVPFKSVSPVSLSSPPPPSSFLYESARRANLVSPSDAHPISSPCSDSSNATGMSPTSLNSFLTSYTSPRVPPPPTYPSLTSSPLSLYPSSSSLLHSFPITSLEMNSTLTDSFPYTSTLPSTSSHLPNAISHLPSIPVASSAAAVLSFIPLLPLDHMKLRCDPPSLAPSVSQLAYSPDNPPPDTSTAPDDDRIKEAVIQKCEMLARSILHLINQGIPVSNLLNSCLIRNQLQEVSKVSTLGATGPFRTDIHIEKRTGAPTTFSYGMPLSRNAVPRDEDIIARIRCTGNEMPNKKDSLTEARKIMMRSFFITSGMDIPKELM